MTQPPTRQQIGATNRRKAAKSERDLAAYLRANGWPNAERKADPGWKTHNRESADHGDIRGTPHLAWQLKYVTGMTDREIAQAMDDAATQAVAAGADYGIMVQRRSGKADPADWWAWLPISDMSPLIIAATTDYMPPNPVRDIPVRVTIRGMVHLLHHAGYGTPSTPDTTP